MALAVPTTEDELCERFTKSTSRDADGRFCVALPFRHHFLTYDDGIQIPPPPPSPELICHRVNSENPDL